MAANPVGVYAESGSGGGIGFCGVDSSNRCEIYTPSGGKVYLVGYYLNAEAVFFDNYINKSQDTLNTWVDTDISGDTGADTAIAAIVCFTSGGTSPIIGVRPNGSSESTTNIGVISTGRPVTYITVGCDANEIFEQNVNTTNCDCYLVGYLKSNYESIDPPLQKVATRYSTYQNYSLVADDIIDDGTINGLYYFIDSTSTGIAICVPGRDITNQAYWAIRGIAGGWVELDNLNGGRQYSDSSSKSLRITGVSKGPKREFIRPIIRR
jgi:hypothetical protein